MNRMMDSQAYDSTFLLVIWVISIAASVFSVICQWKVLAKAGEPGWACLIPFYGNWCHFRSVWGSGAKMFLLLIPFVNVIIAIMDVFKTAYAYGKSGAFGFGLLFLSPVFYAILAFDDSTYQGPM